MQKSPIITTHINCNHSLKWNNNYVFNNSAKIIAEKTEK